MTTTMPAKSKNQMNGFWLFAQKNKQSWKAQGMRITTNDNLLAVASPLWKVRQKDSEDDTQIMADESRSRLYLASNVDAFSFTLVSVYLYGSD